MTDKITANNEGNETEEGTARRRASHGDTAGEVLSFRLGDVEYAVDILRVQEIRGWTTVTRIPRMPAYVQGVLNLRGSVVPVIDLRLRFGMASREYDDTTVIIIINVEGTDRKRDIGMVVDAVSDVFHYGTDELRDAPEIGTNVRRHFIEGIISREKRMVIMLDIDTVLDVKDFAADHAASDEGEAH